jgi:hypothetical protein
MEQPLSDNFVRFEKTKPFKISPSFSIFFENLFEKKWKGCDFMEQPLNFLTTATERSTMFVILTTSEGVGNIVSLPNYG